jgi:hypothetical protein
MDIGNIKEHSDLNFEVAQAKKNALEKLRSRQLMAYNERLFTADADTMNLVSTLKQNNKDFYMLDVNENPCHIKDPDDFLNNVTVAHTSGSVLSSLPNIMSLPVRS